MSLRLVIVAACGLFSVGLLPVQAESPPATTAISRGLEFIQADAVKWREEKQCATCHHGALTVWVQCEAKSRGYDVDAEHFAENVSWTKERLSKIDEPRDTRPGWSMVNSVALNLATMAWCVPEQTAISTEELQKIAGHLVRHQEADGSWSWASAPAKNRPPPFFESDEVATLLGTIALTARLFTEHAEGSEIRAAHTKAVAWLAQAEPTDTTQAAAYRLLLSLQQDDTARRQQNIDRLLARQNKDGGWGQVPDTASDAYATGQALYVLNLAGVPTDHEAITRGVKFLVETQQADGSWPMIRRGHPGVTPGEFKVPIIYFGSAWGTLGLLRSVPKP